MRTPPSSASSPWVASASSTTSTRTSASCGRCPWRKSSPRDLRRLPPRELRGHPHREVEVVEADLLDVHPERDRVRGRRHRVAHPAPQRTRDLERRLARVDLVLQQRLLRLLRDARPEPQQELDVAVVRHGSEAQEDGGRPEPLGGAAPPPFPPHPPPRPPR